MKAVIWSKYGSPEVLKLQDIEKPIPGDNEILIKVSAATVTAGDCEMRSLKIPFLLALPMRIYAGFWRPKRINILGQEFSGMVEAVGKNVTQYQPGERVFGVPGFGFGTYAEYICLPEVVQNGVVDRVPVNLTLAQAATIPVGGLEALHFLRKAEVQRGQKVLINGAGGSIGTIAVQLARYFGADVTTVDAEEKLQMLRSIGANHVIDYREEDFTKNESAYDVIFDVVGKVSIDAGLRALKENGYYLLANPKIAQMMRGSRTVNPGRKKIIVESTKYMAQDLRYLTKLIEAGKIKPVIDRHFPLGQAVIAHRYVEAGKKQGSVVIDF